MSVIDSSCPECGHFRDEYCSVEHQLIIDRTFGTDSLIKEIKSGSIDKAGFTSGVGAWAAEFSALNVWPQSPRGFEEQLRSHDQSRENPSPISDERYTFSQTSSLRPERHILRVSFYHIKEEKIRGFLSCLFGQQDWTVSLEADYYVLRIPRVLTKREWQQILELRGCSDSD